MAKETKKSGQAAPQPPVNDQYDWSQEQVTGFETVRAQDLGIPFLMILQAMSPEVDRANPDYPNKKIAGAQPGSIINTVSRQLLYQPDENPILLIPCGYDRKWIEWKPRTSGGGFVKAHSSDNIMGETTKDETNSTFVLRNGNIIRETAYFFVLVVEVDGKPLPEPTQAIMGLASSQLRNARIWLNIMSGIKMTKPNSTERFTPPMFSHYYSIGTKPESGDKGNWMGWKIETSDPVKDVKLIAQAKETTSKVVKEAQRLLAAPPAGEDDNVPFK